MTLWSYISLLVLDPGYLPPNWEGTDEDDQERFCVQCNSFQPERTRHCDDCKRCVMGYLLNYDGIVCVGFKTKKALFLFLCYWSLTFLYSSCVYLWLLAFASFKSSWFSYVSLWMSLIGTFGLFLLSFKSMKSLFSLFKSNSESLY